MFNLLNIGLIISRLLGHDSPPDTPGAKGRSGFCGLDLGPLLGLLQNGAPPHSPEKALELYKNLMALRQLEKEMYRLMLEDRQRARAAPTSRWRRIGLLWLVIGGIIACLYVMQQPTLPKEVLAVISALAGILGACLKDIYAFEFGSSEIPKASH